MATRSFHRSLFFSNISCRFPLRVVRPVPRNIGIRESHLRPSSWTGTPLQNTFPLRLQLSRILQFSHSKVIAALRTTYFERGAHGRGQRNDGSKKDPWSRIRSYIDRIPQNVVFYGILGSNILVYLAWSWAIQNYVRLGAVGPYRFMIDNFTVSWPNFREATWMSLHFSAAPLIKFQMDTFDSTIQGPAVLSLLGNTTFLGLYLSGGVICSAVSLLWNKFFTHRRDYFSLGASGAVYSVLAFYACAFPTTTFLLFFIIPVPAWACMTGLFTWDLYSAIIQKGSTIDSAGHVGGILGGVLFYLRMRNRHMFF
ncbi:hypothetical protein BS47DRAFT_1288692 [Hydnum rufescens UP504]|uniref:Peptidase S54 rhomboid domain-containing protein n=1 Tax=Hydnum rufescens UP504 TaxID=1448309 RepID=A0A9P6B7G7_9AGAM|nr:hypothetical protein BS47DRAFT_1288692 [Hydnum rufescens UP504]